MATSLLVVSAARASAPPDRRFPHRRSFVERSPRGDGQAAGGIRAAAIGRPAPVVKIDRLEVVPYSLQFREPYVTARGRLERRELVLLRVRADGLEGLGEGAPLSLRGGPPATEIAQDLDEVCRPLLEGA